MSEKRFDFEKAIEDLNKIVTEMEQGGLTLEKSLFQFERGVALTRECQKVLNQAEQKVKTLMEKNAELTLEDYHAEE